MKAKILSAYWEVTTVKIFEVQFDSQHITRVTFEGDDHYARACAYVEWINEGTIGGGYNP